MLKKKKKLKLIKSKVVVKKNMNKIHCIYNQFVKIVIIL